MQWKRGTAVLWWLAVAVVVVVGFLLPWVWDHTGDLHPLFRINSRCSSASASTAGYLCP